MKKRFALVVAAILTFALVAFGQQIATDYGSKDITNHSNGVITFPYNKLQNARSNSSTYQYVVRYYTTVAQYPTQFKPTASVFDGGCQKHQLAEDSSNTPSGLNDGGYNVLFCRFDLPISILDAGTFTFFKNTDGGYAVSQCPASVAINQTAFPAFCDVQLGGLP